MCLYNFTSGRITNCCKPELSPYFFLPFRTVQSVLTRDLTGKKQYIRSWEYKYKDVFQMKDEEPKRSKSNYEESKYGRFYCSPWNLMPLDLLFFHVITYWRIRCRHHCLSFLGSHQSEPIFIVYVLTKWQIKINTQSKIPSFQLLVM